MIKRVSLAGGLALAMLHSLCALADAEPVQLIIESWRNDDLPVWQTKILPEFEKAHPDIRVVFAPTHQTEYDAALGAKLTAKTAGDLITCRPFDGGLDLYKRGFLEPVDDIPGVEAFSAVAKGPFSTDDGKTTFCVPIASVLHGFIYNRDAFQKLGLQVPRTEDEFFALLDKIKADGTYVPLGMGTADQWPSAMLAYQNIGGSYWHGEEGRRALIAGTQRFTDPAWVEPFRTIARWRPYLPEGFEAQSSADSQNFFSLGRAAVYPAGSWDITIIEQQAQFKLGAFPPPVPKSGDTCTIEDHPDLGLSINTASKNKEAAKVFLSWVASPAFASLYANALPGFFSLSPAVVTLDDPLAQEFASWRSRCESTIRPAYQILSRGTPNLESELWRESTNVINGTETPEKAAQALQTGLESWYGPQQKH